MKLAETISDYNAAKAQTSALRWLEASIGVPKYVAFTSIWRRGVNQGFLSLPDVWTHYDHRLKHHVEALDYLDANVGAAVKAEFFRLWKIATSKAVLLDVPFYSQIDNLHEPERSCNTSSCAMAARYLGAKIAGDDDYYARFVKGKFDTTDHGGHTRALAQLGIKSEWRTDLGFDDLEASLKRLRPIVIGILHRGSESAPRGGHIIVVIGRDESGHSYRVHDPYGNISNGYQSSANDGKAALYSRWMLKARWLPYGEGGWGRVFN